MLLKCNTDKKERVTDALPMRYWRVTARFYWNLYQNNALLRVTMTIKKYIYTFLNICSNAW